MTVVLGIDAAWTEKEPSGVALIRGNGSNWRCVAVTPSYESFLSLANGMPVDWTQKPAGSQPNVEALLEASQKLLRGAEVNVVAVDMPLSKKRIRGRREADKQISRKFGKYNCSVHSPSEERPGKITDLMRKEFEKHKFSLATKATKNRKHQTLLEVYPHTALLKLFNDPKPDRVKYKVSKAAKYWRSYSQEERRRKILKNWEKILKLLGSTIKEIKIHPNGESLGGLKRYEDAIDALICAWVGIEYIAERAIPYSDETAAIWTPKLSNQT